MWKKYNKDVFRCQCLDFIITGGKVADCTQFEELIEGLKAEIVLADRGYNSNVTVKTIEKQGAEPIIPPKRNRKVQRFYDKKCIKRGIKSTIYSGF